MLIPTGAGSKQTIQSCSKFNTYVSDALRCLGIITKSDTFPSSYFHFLISGLFCQISRVKGRKGIRVSSSPFPSSEPTECLCPNVVSEPRLWRSTAPDVSLLLSSHFCHFSPPALYLSILPAHNLFHYVSPFSSRSNSPPSSLRSLVLSSFHFLNPSSRC